MRLLRVSVLYIFGVSALGSIGGVFIFDGIEFAWPLLIVLMLSLLTTRRTVVLVALFLGLFFEIISPFSPFAYTFALLTTMYAIQIGMHYYISHRTLAGAFFVGLIGQIIFSLAIAGFSRLGGLISAGWIPEFGRLFAINLIWQGLYMAIVTTGLVALIRRASPSARGVMISYPQKYI